MKKISYGNLHTIFLSFKSLQPKIQKCRCKRLSVEMKCGLRTVIPYPQMLSIHNFSLQNILLSIFIPLLISFFLFGFHIFQETSDTVDR